MKKSTVLFHTRLFWRVNNKNIFPLGFTWKNKFLLKKNLLPYLTNYYYYYYFHAWNQVKNFFFTIYFKPAGFTPGTNLLENKNLLKYHFKRVFTDGNIKWTQRLSWTFPNDGSPEKQITLQWIRWNVDDFHSIVYWLICEVSEISDFREFRWGQETRLTWELTWTRLLRPGRVDQTVTCWCVSRDCLWSIK